MGIAVKSAPELLNTSSQSSLLGNTSQWLEIERLGKKSRVAQKWISMATIVLARSADFG